MVTYKIILYDIKYTNKKEYNRTKRLFYYHLKKIKNVNYLTKSAILCDDERQILKLIYKFRNIEGFVIESEKIHEINRGSLTPLPHKSANNRKVQAKPPQ
jgi:hypothetical protein